jgi:hypothetical protein
MNEELLVVCGESSGVPIILCPVELVNYWEGCNEPSNGRVIKANFRSDVPNVVHEDYDRACDAAIDYVNTIQIGPGEALIFGDEIPYMSWITSESFEGGYLTTSICCLDEEGLQIAALIKSLHHDFFKDTNCTVTCSSEGFLLFPSTQAPMDGDYFESAKISCPAGSYNAAIGFYEPTPDTSIRIIKIQRQDS